MLPFVLEAYLRHLPEVGYDEDEYYNISEYLFSMFTGYVKIHNEVFIREAVR